MIFVRIADAYRIFARKHPIAFTGISLILAVMWATVIVRFSREDADISGARSAKIIVGLANTVAPSADITLENYESVPFLHNSERVVRKLAHMTEYAILAVLEMSFLFGFRDLPRKYTYLFTVISTGVLAFIDEKKIQTMTEGRYGSWIDIGIDMLAAVIAVRLVYLLTGKYRRKKMSG
ncbi:MAG: VanZ family protein [Lachnospiraceae bacterium]|nr:VanZ family protein [Lachnospiraceae bacterium]